MSSEQKDFEEGSHSYFVHAYNLYRQGDGKKLIELISREQSNRDWCERVINYLMTTCGSVVDDSTSENISVIGMVCGQQQPRDVNKVLQFARYKLEELQRVVSEHAKYDEKQLGDSRNCGYMLIWLVAAIRTDEAILLMQELCEGNRGNEYEWVSGMSLDYMKQKRKEGPWLAGT